MRWIHALAGIPALLVLIASIVVACTAGPMSSGAEALTAGLDVARVRSSLMATVPVGTPIEAARSRLRDRGLSCSVSEPPLANLTWPVVRCTIPSLSGNATLQVDVAGRNGVTADIGVEDLSCLSRADATDPLPRPVDCDISGKRLLAMGAQRRDAETALVAELLKTPAPLAKPSR
ncbi:MAG: hypothetical protein ACRYGP_21030 [Janthinobacterium lividum]